ncbi:hypothetical protein GNF10_34540 [Nostoc sp. UCD121]|nr:hypothetical protein [Nostoc sp. UCD120]MBC1220719.1 hypothetical protein [Nostoc sp. UCD120]MBC1280917.1 hypothetical protein [Nostoc sp. UCD121]
MWFQNRLVCGLKRLCLQFATPICATSGDRFKIAPSPQLFNIIAMAYQE